MLDLSNNCDADCMKQGSNWSTVYLVNGILMILIFFNLGCIIMGRIRPKWRLLASYTGFALALAHLGIIVTTAIYRFNSAGALCALRTSATNVPTTNGSDSNDDWTYEKDGSLILALWIL